eukprot:NODE_229_length_12207_cov_1.116700.p4 type:complete len:373 gc:universal NODE_229_length_12207_cov_1.116700:7350-8468(+)
MTQTFTVYHTEWSTYGRNYQISDLPIDEIPNISYAFINVDEQGNLKIMDPYATLEKRFTENGVLPLDTWNENDKLPYYGNFNQLRKLKMQHKFQLTLAIGGWTLSKNFSSAVKPENANNFVNSLLQFLEKYTIFDGVSFDWEYLSNDGVNYGNGGNVCSPSDDINFVNFLELFKRSLNKPLIISFCCTADPQKIKFDVPRINSLIDEWHIMTYDFHSGNWGEKICAHQSNLYPVPYARLSIKESVDSYIKLGADACKIMIGAVGYSRGFSNTDGPGKAASGGSPDRTWEDGVVDYKKLPLSGSIEYFDEGAGASYSYDSSRRVFNSYDTPQSIELKCKFIKDMNLKGCIFWESSGDAKNDRSLITALHKYLK